MKYSPILLLLFTCFQALSQTYSVTGSITDEHNTPPIKLAEIKLWQKDSAKYNGVTDKDGKFLIKSVEPGYYYLSISSHGFENYSDSFSLSNSNVNLGKITLHPTIHLLDEVSIVEKILAMVQKDDTLEFNSGAYKVNPDADAADLIRKMPTLEINDKQITAQGESVIKVLVDGKPFFGDDPYTSLKNLPADVIDKVQVYNEKSEQEKFTGFSEGNTTKTVNIITKPGKRNGVFGTIYAGGGGDNVQDDKYGTGLTLNKFGGDRRITLTAQSNNVNAQNFSTDNSATQGGGGVGVSQTNAAGVNYSDKWGKLDISGSYFFSEVNNSVSKDLRKTYLLSVDSGQVYNELSPSTNQNYSHRINMRLNYAADSFTSLLWTPAFSLNKNSGNSLRVGNTEEALAQINNTADTNIRKSTTYSLNSNLLFRHRFHKKGRTFSLSLNANNNSNDGTALHTAQNLFYLSPSLNDTLNQQTIQQQNTWNLAANATYTEPIQKNGTLKVEYNISYLPSFSVRNTNDYSYTALAYSLPDSQYSNSFYSKNITHKAGASYQLHTTDAEFSIGLNYQLTQLRNNQQSPIKYRLNLDFQNLLPSATVHYKISKTRNLQVTYNTNTQAPSVNQLQNVVNNTDPLHLYTGNPSLKQPYRHNLTIRYNTTAKNAKNNFSVSLNGAYTQHYITSGSIIAMNDTTISQHIILAKGSQLTMPVNTEGNSSVNTNISCGLPLSMIKCHLNLSINAGISNVPGVINNQTNYQQNKNGGLGISISSNISEHVDFIISSNTSVVSNENSINIQLNTTYISQSDKASLNLIFWKGIIFNTAISYQTNSGLSAGYNQNYALWNLSIGKKVFKKHQGDIRISAFDLLNENNNIQHTVTDIYIQDTRSNILQRYFLLVFTYKLSEFKK